MKIIVTTLVLLLITSAAFAQFQPQGAHVLLYFPQLANGGPESARWQTTFVFVNPNTNFTTTPAFVRLEIFTNAGTPLNMDFGSGPLSRHEFTIPPGGSRILRSKTVSPVTVVGWAIAGCSVPVQATVSYRQFINGVPKQEVSAQPTLPTMLYTSPANRFTGVAIGNVNSSPISVNLFFRDAEGRRFGNLVQVSVSPLGHTAFILEEKIPNLGTLSGVLTIEAVEPPNNNKFVAWTLGSDESGVLSTLPPGNFSWPISHWDRIWLVFQEVSNAAIQGGFLTSAPELEISQEQVVNAFGGATTVKIHLALSQLISDSPSELAFLIGHELGHTYQQRNGDRKVYHTNPEFDADVWGVLLAMRAGYDPYGIAGALSKMAMATGRAGLASQFFESLDVTDAHKSFNTRVANAFDTLNFACNSSPSAKAGCDEYKRIFHPNFPQSAPLLPKEPAP